MGTFISDNPGGGVDTIDIFLESSFFTVASGIRDVYSVFSVGQSDKIGLRDTVSYYTAASEINTALSNPVDIFLTYSGAWQDGFISTIHRYEANVSISGVEVALIDYSIPTTVSGGIQGTDEFDLEYFSTLTKISGALDARTRFTAGQLYLYGENILGNYWTFADDITAEDYEGDYTAGGHYDPLIPGPPADQVISSGIADFGQYFTMGSGSPIGTIQEELEVFFAGYPMVFNPEKYSYRVDLIAGLERDKQAAEWETTVISGSVLDIPIDVLSTATTSGYFNTDEVCGLVDLVSFAGESEVVSGTIGYYLHETICGVSGTGGYSFDVDLFSLKISNFSLDVDGYTSTSGIICVDITDDVYNVVPSGSYFIMAETTVSATSFTPITDGYTMCYDSPTDFDNITGSTTVTVHTENDNGDTLERDFYLTSGYVVEYDNRTQDYGFGSQVVVRATAENQASCPDTGTDAYFFTTSPKPSIDLAASIVGIPWQEKNLSAEIVPQTDTVYFYGKVFRIEVRAKDFAGNVMEPFTFEFKIEDKPD